LRREWFEDRIFRQSSVKEVAEQEVRRDAIERAFYRQYNERMTANRTVWCGQYPSLAMKQWAEGKKNSYGLIVAPAGSGKTWIAASIIKHYHEFYPDMSFGWMAPTRETCQQARTSLRVAGVPDEIVDVRCPHESVDFSKKNLLIVDEAKHSPAAGWRRIIESCNGLRYGFDATP